MRFAADQYVPKRVSRNAWFHLPEFQPLGEKRLLCLLCARVVSTTTWAHHSKGIEHRMAKAELEGK